MIEKISIPNDDVPGWMQTLREGGFTDEEIDTMLVHLNPTYAGEKQKVAIEQELTKMNNEITLRRGYPLSDEEKANLKKGIESRFTK